EVPLQFGRHQEALSVRCQVEGEGFGEKCRGYQDSRIEWGWVAWMRDPEYPRHHRLCCSISSSLLTSSPPLASEQFSYLQTSGRGFLLCNAFPNRGPDNCAKSLVEIALQIR